MGMVCCLWVFDCCLEERIQVYNMIRLNGSYILLGYFVESPNRRLINPRITCQNLLYA